MKGNKEIKINNNSLNYIKPLPQLVRQDDDNDNNNNNNNEQYQCNISYNHSPFSFAPKNMLLKKT